MARGGFPGGFGGGNMNNLMKQAQKLQKEMEENGRREEALRQDKTLLKEHFQTLQVLVEEIK